MERAPRPEDTCASDAKKEGVGGEPTTIGVDVDVLGRVVNAWHGEGLGGIRKRLDEDLHGLPGTGVSNRDTMGPEKIVEALIDDVTSVPVIGRNRHACTIASLYEPRALLCLTRFGP